MFEINWSPRNFGLFFNLLHLLVLVFSLTAILVPIAVFRKARQLMLAAATYLTVMVSMVMFGSGIVNAETINPINGGFTVGQTNLGGAADGAGAGTYVLDDVLVHSYGTNADISTEITGTGTWLGIGLEFDTGIKFDHRARGTTSAANQRIMTHTFSDPVYGYSMAIGGLDNDDRAELKFYYQGAEISVDGNAVTTAPAQINVTDIPGAGFFAVGPGNPGTAGELFSFTLPDDQPIDSFSVAYYKDDGGGGSVFIYHEDHVYLRPRVAVTKTSSFDQGADSNTSVGDEITYTFVVENTGEVALTNVSVVDDAANFTGAGSLSAVSLTGATGGATAANMPVGSTLTYQATYNLLAADLNAGSIDNQVNVTADPVGSVAGTDQTAGSDTETTTIPAPAPVTPILAEDDAASNVNGAVGDANVLDVFADNGSGTDTLGGVDTSLADTDITVTTPATPLSPGDPVPVLNPATGVVAVPAGTPAAVYTIVYNLCETANPTNCDPATVTIPVIASTITADDETVSTPVDTSTAQTGVVNVLDGDTLNGAQALDADVTLAPVGSLPTGFTLNQDGTVDIAANTPSGTYTFDYTICEDLNPTNCATATVTIPVVGSITADDETVSTPVDTSTAQTGVVNVLDGDTLNGAQALDADVTLAPVGSLPTGFTLNQDGTVDIAANTPSGTYTFDYTICEDLNPTNCATATVTIPVVGPIVAEDDSAPATNGLAGANDVINVLANNGSGEDTLNGAATNLTDVSITVTSAATPLFPGSPVPVLDPATGNVSVPAGTPAGSYTIVYDLCEVANPTNCDPATVTVPVNAATVVAENDTANGINGFVGAPDIINVLESNGVGTDTLNGVDATLATTDISIDTPATPLAPGAPVPVLDPVTGNVSVPAGTPAGIYTIVYDLCDALNPANCDQAVVSVAVDPPLIVAEDDTAASVDGLSGNPNVLDVLAANGIGTDEINGSPASLTDVTIAVTTPATPNNPGDPVPSLDPVTGIVSVPPNTPAGPYTIVYNLCDAINPTNCDPATVTLNVGATPIVAQDDAATGVNGGTGNPNVLDVLSDNGSGADSLNGSPTTLAATDITVTAPATPLNPGDPVPVLDPATGIVSVPAGTPAGSYTIAYDLCEELNPANCDPALVTVDVGPSSIVAVNDNPPAVDGLTGDPNVANVLDTDTLNGGPVVPSDVTLTVTTPAVPINPGDPVPAIDPATGVVSVPAGTPAGTYPITYQICENLNPTNCATAIATVVVGTPAIAAVDDTPAPVNGLTGGDTPTVFSNDTLNAAPFVPADVTPTIVADGGLTGVTINPDGTLTVPAGTPAGSYPVEYQICEVLNPANCDTAIATIVVDAPAIAAVDDTLPPISSLTGGDTPTVFTNDTLNGAPFVPADVTPSIVTDGGLTGVTINPDGTLSVPAGTPAGSYPVEYQICEAFNPTNCTTAVATVVVDPAPIDAVDDASPPVVGSTGNPNVLNVLDNDTLSSAAVVPAEVVLTVTIPAVPVNPGDPVPSIDPATGIVSVPPGTPVGTYPITYQICEVLNPANCDTATVSVPVLSEPINAVDVTVSTPVDTANPADNVANVLTGDTLGPNPVDPTAVTVTPVGTLPTGFTLNPDGSVDIDQFTPTGVYTFNYQVCEILNPLNCDVATVTIPVEKSVPVVSGTVFLDRNGNGSFESGVDPVLPNYTVELMRAGVVVRSTTSDNDGNYEIRDFDAGSDYSIVFRNPTTGIVVGGIQDLTIAADDVLTNQDQPIDPSGVIYDVTTGLPVTGASISLTDAGGTPLPAACLLPGQQSQTTGADGFYRFDVVPGGAPQCPAGETEYRLAVTNPAGFLPGLSASFPPQAGSLDATTCPVDAIPGGACQLSASTSAPAAGSPTPYYTSFLLAAGDPNVINNHIPLEPFAQLPADGLTVEKRASVAVARRGDVVGYTITLNNTNLVAAGALNVTDTLPTGFLFQPGSAQVDGVNTAPVVDGQRLTFTGITVPPSGSVVVTLNTRIGANVSSGEHTNRALATDPATGNALSATARAVVRIETEHVFDCGEIVGKVFDDVNRNGYQNKGERGLPGVRVATVKGLLITTDKYGRFNVPCAAIPDGNIGSNFILKLDERTLPSGFQLTTENPRVVRLTRGKLTKLNFGASIGRVIRIDLNSSAFGNAHSRPSQKLATGIDRLIRKLSDEPSVLKVAYVRRGESKKLANARMRAVEKLVNAKWKAKGVRSKLSVETRIVKGR